MFRVSFVTIPCRVTIVFILSSFVMVSRSVVRGCVINGFFIHV